MGKGKEDGGCPRGGIWLWRGPRLCQEAHWSAGERGTVSVFEDSCLRAVDVWRLGTGLNADFVSPMMSSLLLKCPSVLCFW